MALAPSTDTPPIPFSRGSVNQISIPDTSLEHLLDPPERLDQSAPISKPDLNISPANVEELGEHPPTTAEPDEATEGSGAPPTPPPPQKSDKPQVIVRIRPSPNIGNNIFEVDSETKTIQIRVDRENLNQNPYLKPPPAFIYFPADNVLENSSQEDTFNAVALDVIEKGMQGVNGMIVAVGPEVSGKTFSLFGLTGRYRNRGIIARALEKMFEIRDIRKAETEFRFMMGIIEVRRERIRDLLTLGPYEINDIGEKGPKGMYTEEVDCLEHGLGLLLRALIGQKLMHQQPYERYHTIVYLEIIGVSPMAQELVHIESRLTFVEIASAPYENKEVAQPPNPMTMRGMPQPQCTPPPPPKMDTKFKTKQSVFPSRKCCNPGHTTGPLAESIAVRRDVFALEQIFLKANEMQRIRKYFTKLEDLGLSMIASEKRRFAKGHNFRHSKLAHCLKDILNGSTNIRILLHVRPDKTYLRSSLEAMRFAERARLVPANMDGEDGKRKRVRTEDQILQEVIVEIAPELTHPANIEMLTSEKMRAIQEQAVQYFDNNIKSMKVCSKDKVKQMFENFRVLWNFLWEVELNVTLRKAQEEMRVAFNQPPGVDGTTDGGGGGGGTHVVDWKDGAIAVTGGEENQMPQSRSKQEVQTKRSKKLKKEKSKRRAEKNQKRESNANDIKTGSPVSIAEPSNKRSSNFTRKTEETLQTTEEGRASLAETETKPAGDQRKSFDVPLLPPLSGPTVAASIIVDGPPLLKVSSGDQGLGDAEKTEGGDTTGQQAGDKLSGNISDPEALTSPSGIVTLGLGESGNKTTPSMSFRQSIFPKSFLDHGENEQNVLSDEERAAMASKLEEQISNNFEDMKKVARRQAIMLLRTGVKRPPWMSLF